MKILLHICCAVCACELTKKFQKEGHQVTGYFYNPNIHPFKEFQKRLKAVATMARQDKLKVHYDIEYGLDDFLETVHPDDKTNQPERCAKCYWMRLEKTAKEALKLGCDEFTSTLIISPQQKQDVIESIGKEISKRTGVKFRYEKITGLYKSSKETAKKRALYRQQYCGCIFSEAERYNV